MSGHVVIIYNRAGTSCRVRGSVLAGTDDGYGDNGVCDQVWDKRNFVDIRRARDGKGPGLLECMTYRFRDHHNVGNGVDGRFRTEEELDGWEDRCPIERLKKRIISDGIVDESGLWDMEKEIEREIERAFRYAGESACPDPAELYDGLWG